MSDDDHHFESKADAGASKTYPQQAGTIRKNGYIVIKNCPCKIKDGFGEGKDLVVTVISAMGEEQICDLKEIGRNQAKPWLEVEKGEERTAGDGREGEKEEGRRRKR